MSTHFNRLIQFSIQSIFDLDIVNIKIVILFVLANENESNIPFNHLFNPFLVENVEIRSNLIFIQNPSHLLTQTF